MTSGALVEHCNDYLQLRHAMGHRLTKQRSLIGGFLADVAAAGGHAITVDAAVRWACSPAGASTRT